MLVARLEEAVASELASAPASQDPPIEDPIEDTEAAPPVVAEPEPEPAAEPEATAMNTTAADQPAPIDDAAAVVAKATTEVTIDEPAEELDYGDETELETPSKKRRAGSHLVALAVAHGWVGGFGCVRVD